MPCHALPRILTLDNANAAGVSRQNVQKMHIFCWSYSYSMRSHRIMCFYDRSTTVISKVELDMCKRLNQLRIRKRTISIEIIYSEAERFSANLKLHPFISRFNEHGVGKIMPKWHEMIQTKVLIQRNRASKSSGYQTLRCGRLFFSYCVLFPPLLLAWVKLFYTPSNCQLCCIQVPL